MRVMRFSVAHLRHAIEACAENHASLIGDFPPQCARENTRINILG
jgi:hypothetical protein